MNKRGVAKLVIFGIPIAVVFIFLVRLWAANMIFEAIQPELQKALNEFGSSD